MPKISKEMILFTLHRYRDLDLHIQKNKERLIDGLVKAIYLYDDKLVFYLTYTDDPVTIPTAEELEEMEHSSDFSALSSPKRKPHLSVWFSFWWSQCNLNRTPICIGAGKCGQQPGLILNHYETRPYFTLMRSSFSSIGSAAMRMKITVAAACTRSIGRPDT